MIPQIVRHPVRVCALLLFIATVGVVRVVAQASSDGAPTTGAPAVAGVAPAESHLDDSAEAAAGSADSSGMSAIDAADEPTPLDSLHTDPPRLTQEEYYDGGNPRYTMHGKLPYRETNIQPLTLGIFGGALLALAGGVTWYQQAWYPDSTKTSFHLQTDWGYSKQYDKAGHMYGGFMSAYCSFESFIASGFSRDDAALWGSLGGLFFQTVMEVQDGFFEYGFDPTDELANAVGAGFFYAQQKIPVLQYFNPKWSFGPNPRDSAREASQIRSRIIVDDYDRQDVWLSAKLHYLLPESMRPYWPKWLSLAIGAGARDVELGEKFPAYRTLHISLDYDLVAMLPDLGSFGNWLLQGLNNFKLPAPALQVWPHVEFKLLYPFKL